MRRCYLQTWIETSAFFCLLQKTKTQLLRSHVKQLQPETRAQGVLF